MEPTTLLATGAIAILISYAVLAWIIRIATRTDEAIKFQQIQINLLSRLLKENGVSNEELEEIKNI